MTPKAEFFGRIEDYCLNLLDANEKQEFERELTTNEELREEVQLHKDIQAAVLELDVQNLKSTLNEIHKENVVTPKENGSFALLEELKEVEEMNDELTFEELINSFESLPKVHVYQHEKTLNENVHRFYEEQQNGVDVNGIEEEELNGFDMTDLEGLEEAVLETDILNLRDTLQQVAKSVEPQYSVEEIDSYLSGEMGDDILAEFEVEMKQNRSLLEEVSLHRDIEGAIEEFDIMSLRDEMRGIMDSETSWNVSEQNIEDFIDGILEEDLLEEFNAELKENTDLMAEVFLREQINSAVGEKDIQNLRAQLSDARNAAETKEVKSIVMPQFDLRSTRFWRNSVAMIVVLVGLAGVLRTNVNSVDNTYDKYFESPVWASERSATNSLDDIQTARLFYQNADYSKVVTVLDNASLAKNEMFVAHFYKALSYQNLNKLDKAITEYSKVIDDGDNMYIEEAEWYRSLCYLRLNKKSEAKKELLAVIDRKGYYENDAKAIIRKLKYSIK